MEKMMKKMKANIANTGVKNQSALEFLITYSWAIAIIGLVLAILGIYFTGLPKPSLKFQCIISPQFPCYDAFISTNSTGSWVYFSFQNKMDKSIRINKAFVTYNSINFTGSCSPSTIYPNSYSICKIQIPSQYVPAIGGTLNLGVGIDYDFV